MNNWFKAVILSFLFMWHGVVAQPYYANQISRLSTQEGLSQSSVTGFAQDKYGYIWIATRQGLNRFDGNQFSAFHGQKTFSGSDIILIRLLDNDQLFISTVQSGAFLLNTNTFSLIKLFSQDSRQGIAPDAAVGAVTQFGNNYVIAIENVLYQIDTNTYTSQRLATLPNGAYIRTLLAWHDTLLVGTETGLFQLSNSQLVSLSHLGHTKKSELNSNVKLLKPDPALGLLVGTVEGLFVVPSKDKQLQTEQAYQLVPELNIWAHEQGPYGEYLATDSGLFLVDRRNHAASKIFSFSDSRYLTPQNTIPAMLLDDHGNVWMGSNNSGAFIWPTSAYRFKLLAFHEDNFNNNIWAIHQDNDGSLWLGSDDGLHHFSANNHTKLTQSYFRAVNHKPAYGSHAVYNIYTSPYLADNILLLDTRSGVKQFDIKTGRVSNLAVSGTHSPVDDSEHLVGSFMVDQRTLLFHTHHNIYLYDLALQSITTLSELEAQLDTLQSLLFLPARPSKPDELLFSTPEGLLSYNRQSHQVSTIWQSNKKSGNAYPAVNDWEQDSQGRLWLATNSTGLVGLDTSSYQPIIHITENQGLHSNTLYEIERDLHNKLWVSSQSGLYSLNLASLQLNHYDHRNGLVTNEFNLGASRALHSGELVFGTPNGAVKFNPDAFILSAEEEKIRFSNVQVMSRPFLVSPAQLHDQTLQFEYDDIGFRFEFSQFNLFGVRQHFINARLSGPVSVDIQNIKNNYVFFNSLKSGEYTLSLSEYRPGSDEVLSNSQLNFQVKHAWWNTPQAITSYLLFTIGSLAIIYRRHRLKQRALRQTFDELANAKAQIDLALKKTQSGLWSMDIQTQQISLLGNSKGPSQRKPLSLASFFDKVHPQDREMVRRQWARFLAAPDSQLSITYRIYSQQQGWLWYHDIAKVSEWAPSGMPLKVSGVYSNITEHKASQLNAAMFAQALSQIQDWLLILDNNLQLLSVNQSLSAAFALGDQDPQKQLTRSKLAKLLGRQQLSQLLAVLRKIQARENIKQEVDITFDDERQSTVQLSINAIADEQGDIEFLVIVGSDLSQQKQAQSELRYLANFDALTDLPNRNLMLQHIEFAIYNATKNNTGCALLFIDLDKFKPINDAYGHSAGDQLLIAVTKRINSVLTQHCILGRQSGDEFIVLVKTFEDIAQVTELVQQMINTLCSKYDVDGISMSISASVGVAIFPFDEQTAEGLLRNADIAMLSAKQSGRNNFKFFTNEMNAHLSRKLSLEAALKEAVEENQFYNHYQPIMNTTNHSLTGVELLMRWQLDSAPVSPAEFIPIAEDVGLIERMTTQALRNALQELAPFFQQQSSFYLSLNLSPQHIMRDNLAASLNSIIAEFDLSNHQLKLEITETSFLADRHKASKTLSELKKFGFTLLLDDFGTGYSSLTYLSQFPIDIIKIDQSFIRTLETHPHNRSIVKTIYMLAQNLNMACIAEGVETAQQLSFLRDLGCEYMQGYYFSKPLSVKGLFEKYPPDVARVS
ncbi:GGDEF-domain containing protein [Pseudoalteromonas rubra]|uniref:GGDEF-domain containing protein n=1 Tax=Pseudoalteromonas rubra TaxID=43658 RepID=A0A5S3WVG9_9GAMM|nr:EAL domain-containing protein [Pseudoalteromonas rubra]TMP31817.1 GGDEF-domain containing protein [Pseudoalteromonas rubra]TMP33100.1 GGDEF-domain containing protein [Pseudoalteromonas rubra]